MKNLLIAVKHQSIRHYKALVALMLFVLVGSYATGASATGIITSAFTAEGSQILVYFGLAAVIVVAGLGFGVGLKFLVKWVKFAFGRGS